MMLRKVRLRFGILAIGLVVGAAAAQPTVPYEIVDPGRTDSSANGSSLRLVPIDLRTPTGFDTVFRLPTVAGGEMFARMDGGLTAVFPRSEYVMGYAVIPAGTTWYIGALPASVFGVQREGSTLTEMARAQRVDQRPGVQSSSESSWGESSSGKSGAERLRESLLRPVRNPLMPWSGELERRSRVGALIRRAARAG